MSDIIKVPEKEVEQMRSSSSQLIGQAEGIVVSTETEAEQASLFMAKISQKIKELEDRRTSFTKPINEGLKAINSVYKEISEPLDKAKRIIGDKILAWRRLENEKIAKEEQRRLKIQEAHQEAGHTVNAPVELARVPKKVGFAQTRKVWKWKLESFSQLADDYKMTNDVYINQKVREGVRQIKGLTIYEDEIIGSSL